MSWSKTTKNKMGIYTETKTLPGSATTEYTSEINFLKVRPHKKGVSDTTQYVSVTVTASAVSGTNLDIGLYGAKSSGGTKVLLKDAVVADVTNTAKIKQDKVDLKLYPFPYFYIGWTSDGDESANTVTVDISGDLK